MKNRSGGKKEVFFKKRLWCFHSFLSLSVSLSMRPVRIKIVQVTTKVVLHDLISSVAIKKALRKRFAG